LVETAACGLCRYSVTPGVLTYGPVQTDDLRRQSCQREVSATAICRQLPPRWSKVRARI